MIDVFRIGASIGMMNDVSPVIGTIPRDLAGLGRVVDRATGGLRALRLAATGVAGAAGGLDLSGLGRAARAAAGRETVAREAAGNLSRGGPAGGAWNPLPRPPAGRALWATANPVAARSPATPLSYRYDQRRGPGAAAKSTARVAGDGAPFAALAARMAGLAAVLRMSRAEHRPAAARPGVAITQGRAAAPRYDFALVFPTPAHGRRAAMAIAHLAAAHRRAEAPGPLAIASMRGAGAAGDGDARSRPSAAGSLLSGNAGRGMFEAAARGLRAVVGPGAAIGNWGAARRAPAPVPAAAEAPALVHVHVVNAREIGGAAGDAVHRGLRAPAAIAPSLPSPAAMAWAPGPAPAMP